MSMCRVFSCVVGRGYLLWPVHSLGKTLLAFALLHFVLQSQISLLLQVSLDFLLLHSSPLGWRWHLFQVLVLEYLVGLHITFQLQLFQHYWSGHRIGLLWYWMVCRTDIEDYWKRTEIILLFLRLHPRAAFLTLVDYECYSISSEEVLPPVVDIMVIWVKFAHSNPFSSLIPKMSMFTLAMSCLTTSNLP